MTGAQVGSPPRVLFVDVLRLLAAVQMIQGHTIDALLGPAYRSGPWFDVWTFSRGLTSTTFLLTAGMAFVLAARSARDPAAARKRRGRRALKLIFIGYLLHAPLAVLFGSPVGPALNEAFSVDVLQCIGVSLLVIEALWEAFSDWPARALASGLVAVACFSLSVSSAKLVPSWPWFPLSSYFSSASGSLFPLVPWLGYVLFGMAIGLLSFHPGRLRVAARLGSIGGLALALGYALSRLFPGWDPRLSPGFLLLKLGIVLLVAALLARLLEGRERLPSLLSRLAGETLFLYVSHVWLLYAGHVGARALFGSRLSPGEALLVALGLLLLCSAGALGYRAVRVRLAKRPA